MQARGSIGVDALLPAKNCHAGKRKACFGHVSALTFLPRYPLLLSLCDHGQHYSDWIEVHQQSGKARLRGMLSQPWLLMGGI
jgi:hypothetical protein